MDALEVAHLARAMTAANQPEALTHAVLEDLVRRCALLGACGYQRNGVGDRLLPLASVTSTKGDLPSLDMGEVDNPLVFGLRSGQPCLVDNIARLVGAGETFDALRECWPGARALLVLPLRNTRRDMAGVLAFFATAQALRALQADALWQALIDTHESLYARLTDRISREESIRYERSLRRKLEADHGHEKTTRLLASEFVGESATTVHIREDMLRLADSSLPILITGETGSGKDHAAWLIHQASTRGGPFVPVNCAAIAKDLIEAELFGSARGAYTGATQARQGLVAEAHGGTLFLDEIGDMPLALQGVLLRVLNEKKYRPVGATKERESNFRLICATHQPLQRRIREGQFREDLYYRIRQRSLHLPPLRERQDDIPAIASHVLLQYNRAHQSHVAGFSAAALDWLHSQPFPGNVRELRSLVMAAAEQTAQGEAIDTETLHALMAPLDTQATHDGQISNNPTPLHHLLAISHLSEAVNAFERLMIGDRLRQLNGSRSLAAQSLGMPKRTLAYKCQKWNLDRETDAL
ncbi:MAG TPA: sigma-54 dependent transcriptional regulator [Dyella sp.]|uniref:sigma-54 dependent transcriptional regulator n=1 Tax=Dyella sp. TaxID=1869338 RepID=UPI002C495896|nr:sigma-54 dependent transcriptional regulator [Dyella sp.]HTV87197.1 sigma-54 dependent transcriptional regulator [Dyella sp.]